MDHEKPQALFPTIVEHDEGQDGVVEYSETPNRHSQETEVPALLEEKWEHRGESLW